MLSGALSPWRGLQGLGRLLGPSCPKQQPQYLQSGASAGTTERLCLQNISSAWDHTFGKALVCKEVAS